MKLSRILWGSWTWKPFCVPHFLFEGNRLQPPWSSLSSKGQVQTVANQGREGRQRQGRSSQETIVWAWDRILVPPQGIHINSIFELFCRTRTPQQMEDVIYLMKHSSFQREDQETAWGQIKGMQALQTPWSLSATPPPTIAIKLLTKFPLGWDPEFCRARAHCVPLCLAKQ